MNVNNDFDTFEKMFKDNGEKLDLWVCIYLQETVLEKAKRNIKPTKVAVSYSKEHLEGKTTYSRTRYTFTAYKKDGVSLSKKEVSMYGNRGGNDEAIHFFINESECNDKYNEMLYKTIKSIENEREKIINQMNDKIEKLRNDFIGSDYTMETLFRS